MAKTLLNATNEILKRVVVIAGDSGLLTSLTDSARQPFIDAAVQVVNEGIEELYSATATPQPSGQAESFITLVTGTRSYALQTDLVRLHYPLIDKVNNQFISPYPGGYNQILQDDSEQDDDGIPHFGSISPVDGELYLDRIPTAAENNNVYTYQYDKDVSLVVLTDVVPFEDPAFRAMVPAWVQLWKREMRNEFDGELFNASIGRAARFITKNKPRTSWLPR